MTEDNRFNQDAIAERRDPAARDDAHRARAADAGQRGGGARQPRQPPPRQPGRDRADGRRRALCGLLKEGSDDTKDESAWAIWALATNHQGNKDTITQARRHRPAPRAARRARPTARRSTSPARSPRSRRSTRTTGRSSRSASWACSARRRSARPTAPSASSRRARPSRPTRAQPGDDRQARRHHAPPRLARQGRDPQHRDDGETKMLKRVRGAGRARDAVLAADNATTRVLIAKSDGIPPLIALVKKSSPRRRARRVRAVAPRDAAREPCGHRRRRRHEAAHLDAGRGGPLRERARGDHPRPPRRNNSDVAVEIADKGGVLLVKLLSTGSVGSSSRRAASRAALVSATATHRQRGGIAPLIKLLSSTTISARVSARALAHLAYKDERAGARREEPPRQPTRCAARRAPREDHYSGGIGRLIDMVRAPTRRPTSDREAQGLGDVKDDGAPRSA